MKRLERLEWIVIAILILDIIDVGYRFMEKFFL